MKTEFTKAQGQSKVRLDILVTELGLASSRHKAQALIMAGQVLVEGKLGIKSGQLVGRDSRIEVRGELKYVSRGGLKLEPVLDVFEIDPAGMRVLDVGISTGGFSDCLLQRGAISVVGVDVGRGQLAWKLRTDPRVKLFEKANFRHFDPASLETPVDLAVIDVSFISLKLILPVVARCLAPGGTCLPMVKPQFELGRGEVGKGGVVRVPADRTRAVDGIAEFALSSGFTVLGRTAAGIAGPKGNQEYFLHLVKHSCASEPVS